MRYFKILTDDVHFSDRWFLDEPVGEGKEEIDAREFIYGRPYAGPLPFHVPIQQPGRRVQFNLGAFDMPIISEKVASLVHRIAPAEVQCFPVTIGDSISGYVIFNELFSNVVFWLR